MADSSLRASPSDSPHNTARARRPDRRPPRRPTNHRLVAQVMGQHAGGDGWQVVRLPQWPEEWSNRLCFGADVGSRRSRGAELVDVCYPDRQGGSLVAGGEVDFGADPPVVVARRVVKNLPYPPTLRPGID